MKNKKRSEDEAESRFARGEEQTHHTDTRRLHRDESECLLCRETGPIAAHALFDTDPPCNSVRSSVDRPADERDAPIQKCTANELSKRTNAESRLINEKIRDPPPSGDRRPSGDPPP
ncbi:hypothetical protein F2P81_023008 [Scophthalmus maximus]|uniref:Uncharacterized protein n=1 Tax=Scophthalmus maximus TaxID=52904 RepID=A0A6A4RNU7_SCOMX|nr:hypothetical protein F2P81_023008 [Scophthalmus maximus]